MAIIPAHWRTGVAAVFALALIAGAYVVARGIESPEPAQASTETALLKQIAARDSDGDGLPDWEEALYGTNPQVVDTFHLGMTDSQAVAKGLIVPKAVTATLASTTPKGNVVSTDPALPPAPAEGTLTAGFAENFFSLYLAALRASGDGNLSDTDLQNIATQALADLAQSVVLTPDYKSLRNLHTEGSGPDALRRFAAAADAVFIANKNTATKSEIYYLQALVEQKGDDAAAKLLAISKLYRTTAAGLAVLPVPAELAPDYLQLINAMARLSNLTEDFTRVDTDPLTTMLALQQYPQTVLNMGKALIQIGNVYKTEEVTFSADEPGAMFANVMSAIAAEQGKKQTP
ncbi:hypothetical protein COU19_02570 [Candidatus Kaiserbacteria bacterium CG10_big_fil_rev_8_21_14_0_10_56_12]|uniref:Uncharacterized protein n=1 Tax=Candidatus Kaiserbacteria bacterium CG10_big_fil_rev_8_21_14_0_10_56_12 TaxID=1974611 RepID=A0A2H0UB70_9BACT|nr:MAG: hypothetical protein COU19_02570 [Candidatus Kaiserbacteria bacterium CG10_big_fil_rev_8_21_14_0_10_56_12]